MRIATIGTGIIVDTFLYSLNKIDDITCVEIYSRKESTAKLLAEKYNIFNIYTVLHDMLKDPTVDFVIASPNSLHYEHAYKTLQANKHVICEKPFTSNTNELSN